MQLHRILCVILVALSSRSSYSQNFFCGDRLGMESGGIPDSRITASRSSVHPRDPGDCQPKNGRLNQKGTRNPEVAGGWCSKGKGFVGLWFQVDLVEQTLVEGVITQGVDDPLKDYDLYFVSRYRVQYSKDNNEWKVVKSFDSKTEIFEGNKNSNDTITRKFDSPIRARFIRIIPWSASNRPAMRVGLVGCNACPDVVYNGTLGPLIFPSTRVGNVTNSSQQCSSNSSMMATRECAADNLKRAFWMEPIITPCSLETVENKPEDVVATVMALESQLSLDEHQNSDGIAFIGASLIRILQVSMVQPDIQIAGRTVSLLSNLLQLNQTAFDDLSENNVTSRIILALESYISALQKADVGNLTLVESSLAVVAVTLPQEALEYGLLFGSNSTGSGGDQDTLRQEDIFLQSGRGGKPRIDHADVSIQLPYAILKQVNSTEDPVPISFFIYRNSKLFQSPRLRNQGENASPRRVIAATVEGVRIDNLPVDSPVITTFPTPSVIRASETMDRFECVFWDFNLSNGLGDWSSKGCRLDSDISNGNSQTVCHCDHLTSFGVILDIHGNKGGSPFRDYLSRALLAISTVALVITIVSFLAIRKCRNSRPKQILISLSFSLLGLDIVFLTGIEATNHTVGCTIVAVLIHFFALASVAWMAVEATNLYLLLVKVFTHVSHFMLMASIAAWGLPLMVVSIVLAVDHTQYVNEKYCFLRVGNSLYFGQVLIIGIVLLFNFVIFTLVMRGLTCPQKSLVSSKSQDRSTRTKMVTRLKNALFISVLLGLTWVFGLLSSIGPLWLNIAFQVIFEVLNSLQGIAIFLMFCLREQEVRKAWIGVFVRKERESQISMKNNYSSNRTVDQ